MKYLVILCLLYVELSPMNSLADSDSNQAKTLRSQELNEKGVTAVNSNNFDTARYLFEEAMELNAGNITAMYNLAGVYLALKQEKNAIRLLEKYKAKLQDAGVFSRLGDAYFADEDIKKAFSNYQSAYAFDPAFPQLAAKLGTIYVMQNQLVEAEKMFLEAVELDPKNFTLLSNLSNVFLANNDANKAISSAKRALQVKTTSDIYITLGSAYELLKDYKNSLISYQRAQDLGDNTKELKEKIAQIKQIS